MFIEVLNLESLEVTMATLSIELEEEKCTNYKTCHPRIAWSYYLQIVEDNES
jgi:hypothetical protein